MSEVNTRVVMGRVVSDRMDKSITVYVERRVQHALYGKYMRRSTKILAHDADNEAHVGDLVAIADGRPISKRKSWRLVRIVETAGELERAG